MISILLAAAMGVTNSPLVNTNYNITSEFIFKSQAQPETLRVKTIGYKEPFFGQTYSNDQEFSFCWTNLVCETQFKPIVTESNGMWVIKFKEIKK